MFFAISHEPRNYTLSCIWRTAKARMVSLIYGFRLVNCAMWFLTLGSQFWEKNFTLLFVADRDKLLVLVGKVLKTLTFKPLVNNQKKFIFEKPIRLSKTTILP